MLFIGHFEAISTDTQFKNDHEERNYSVCYFYDLESFLAVSYPGREISKMRIGINR
jgi:hypothetical protein